jgi:glycosyltransferase involved in cell wall biosynthesis
MSQRTPLVSVVIAAYNAGQYVGEAIQSVLEQTVLDLDVHVVNDGSTDDTDARVAPFLRDPRVVYHKQANGGQAVAKNRGILNSRGKYVAFCDADDRLTPDKLESQLPLLESAPDVGLAYTLCAKMDSEGKLLSVDSAEQCRRGRVTTELLRFNFVPGASTLLRRTCLERTGVFDERLRMGIDWDLWLRLSLICEFDFIAEPKYLYRMWSGQMSHNWRGRYASNFHILDNFFRNNPSVATAAEQREIWAMQFVERARARARMSREHVRALGDCVRAGLKAPTYMPAWKSMVRIMLWAARLADPRDEDWARPADPATLSLHGIKT